MTHEQFVTLETARLAKQAWFDWECSTFYTETFDYTSQEGTGKFEFRRDDNLRYRNPNDDRNSFVNNKGTLLEYKFKMYSAPTQSVLQRWLREVKNIEICIDWEIEFEEKDLDWNERRYFYNIDTHVDNIPLLSINDDYWAEGYHTFGDSYSTYEAALEAGLQKCLTLLIEKQ